MIWFTTDVSVQQQQIAPGAFFQHPQAGQIQSAQRAPDNAPDNQKPRVDKAGDKGPTRQEAATPGRDGPLNPFRGRDGPLSPISQLLQGKAKVTCAVGGRLTNGISYNLIMHHSFVTTAPIPGE